MAASGEDRRVRWGGASMVAAMPASSGWASNNMDSNLLQAARQEPSNEERYIPPFFIVVILLYFIIKIIKAKALISLKTTGSEPKGSSSERSGQRGLGRKK